VQVLGDRKFPVQVLGEVPEGYGADTWLGSI